MALIEAVLVYRPNGVGHEHPVPIGATDDPRVLRALRDRLLECAYEEVHVWHTIDAGVATLKSAEAERLAGLGGFIPPAIAERLEHRLSSEVRASGEELLVSASVPALEDYKSPARLVALTRSAVLVVEDTKGKFGSRTGAEGNQTEKVYRYDLATISSAQLRQSLLGSSLSIFVPQPEGHVQRHVFPFHSPAIAWFLPLFTRLRLLLSTPY